MTNTKSTKRALISSALALFLCFTMLLGTTFAWFTDSVTSANNVITSGNLDIELEYLDDNGEWQTVDKADKIFDPKALWEPGYTEVVYLRMRNAGSLALKYQLGVNIVDEDDGTNVSGEAFKLSDYIYFDVFENVDGKTAPFADRAAAMKDTTEKTLISEGYTKAGYMLAETTDAKVYEYLAMVVYMPTTVGNVANHNGDAPKIELGVNVMTTQYSAESDSFGNNYDALAGLPWDGKTVTENLTADSNGVYHITSAADLVAMMNDSKYPNCNTYQNVVLECDINLGGHEITGFGDASGFFDGIFDGQGYTISNFKIDASNRTYYAGLFNQVSQYSGENTVIKNLTVENATVVGSGQVGIIVGGMNGNTIVDNCKVINCTAIGVKKVGSVVGYTAGGTVKDCYAENCSVQYSEKEGGEILGYENTGSTVSNNIANNVSVNQRFSASTAGELKNVLAKNTEDTIIYLAEGEYNMGGNYSFAEGTTIVGNGAVMTGGALTNTIKNVTVKDVVFEGTTAQRWGYAGGSVVFENCTFDASSVYAIHYDGTAGADIVYKNCTITGWAAIAGGHNSLTFENCTIYGNGAYGCVRVYGDTTFKDCTFDVSNVYTTDAFQDGIHAVDCTVTVENCTNVNGAIADICHTSGTGAFIYK